MGRDYTGGERTGRVPWGAIALVLLSGLALMRNGTEFGDAGPPQPAAAASLDRGGDAAGPPVEGEPVQPLPYAPASRVKISSIDVDAPSSTSTWTPTAGSTPRPPRTPTSRAGTRTASLRASAAPPSSSATSTTSRAPPSSTVSARSGRAIVWRSPATTAGSASSRCTGSRSSPRTTSRRPGVRRHRPRGAAGHHLRRRLHEGRRLRRQRRGLRPARRHPLTPRGPRSPRTPAGRCPGERRAPSCARSDAVRHRDAVATLQQRGR